MYRLMIKVAIISMLSSLLLWGLEICYAITSGAWMVRGMGGTAFFLLLTFLLFAGWGVVAAIIQWIYLAVAGAVGRRLAKGGSIARAQLGTSLFIAVTLAPYLGCFTWQLFAGKGISKWVWIWHLRIGFFAVSVVGVFLIAWIIVRSTQSWFLPARRCRCVCSSLLGMAFVLVLYALNARMYVGQYDVVHQAMSLVIFFATEFSLINAMGVKRLDRLPGRGVAAVFFGLLFLIPVELATLTYITGGTPGSQQLSYVYSQTHLARQLIWIYDFNRGAEGAEDVYYREYLNRRNQFVACAPALARKGCNFVLIVVDSLRADHLAMYGYGRDTAPNLEALARKSIVFTHAYAQGTDTNTSLPALMTGCYMSSVIRKGGIERMETLPEALKSCGYSTKALVHGYDIRTFGDKQREGAAFDAIDAPEEHFAEHIAQKAVKLLRGDVPFAPLFLWLMYGEPHDPYEKQDGYDFGDRALDLYDSEIAYTDKCIGQVLDCIRDTGHDEDTVVVVTADHGEEIGEYGGWGHAVKLWNAIIHVPLIVYIPRVAPAVVDSPVQLVDVFPSMLNLLDCGYSGFPDGSSFLPCITAGPLPYEALAIAEAHQGGILNKVCAIRYPWKLVYHRSDSYFTLVDLDRDPSEKVNRISERPDIGRLLTRMLLSYLSYQERGATPRGEAAGAAEKTLRRLAANDAGALRELAGIDVAQITPADFDRWASLLKRHFSREVAQFYLAVARARGDLRPAAMRELREIVGNADEIRGGEVSGRQYDEACAIIGLLLNSESVAFLSSLVPEDTPSSQASLDIVKMVRPPACREQLYALYEKGAPGTRDRLLPALWRLGDVRVEDELLAMARKTEPSGVVSFMVNYRSERCRDFLLEALRKNMPTKEGVFLMLQMSVEIGKEGNPFMLPVLKEIFTGKGPPVAMSFSRLTAARRLAMLHYVSIKKRKYLNREEMNAMRAAYENDVQLQQYADIRELYESLL